MKALILALVLQYGTTIPPQPPGHDWMKYKYWSCYDTYIDSSQPQTNYGASEKLVLGDGKTVLIRFSDLSRAAGPNKSVSQAEMVLHLTKPVQGQPNITVYRLKSSWGEGAGPVDKTTWCATWKARRTASGGEPRLWKKSGTGDEDRQQSNARAVVSADGKTITITGLEADLQDMLDQEFSNWGWVITSDSKAPIEIASSQASDPKLRPELRLKLREKPSAPTDYDLSVIYIERQPEYLRYNPGDNAYTPKNFKGTDVTLMDNPGYADEQKWPNDGEKVMFVAHVKNQGTKPVTGFTYEWWINDELHGRGATAQTLSPGEETTFSILWNWQAEHSDHRDQTITFRVEPAQSIIETTRNNNVLTDYIEALQMGFWVEKSFYEEFKKKQIGPGSFSFEDWIQWQINIWNEVYMDRSRYPVLAPDGSLERIRAQKITVVEDGVLEGGVHVPGNKTNFYTDGEWGFEWNDKDPQDSINYIEICRAGAERAFLHESSHQMGLNDVYVQNIDASLPDGERGKVRLKAGTDNVITRGFIDPYGGLMGGGDTRPHKYERRKDGQIGVVNLEPSLDAEPYDLYASIDIGAFNTALGKRRGFFGEYMYDLPEKIVLRFVDAAGNPIPDADIRIFQERGGSFPNDPPTFTGKTDKNGLFPLPDQPTLEDKPFTTLTGHTLRPNPWGRICVVGGNGVFMIECSAYGQKEWQFAKIHEFNVARWLGNEGLFSYDVKMNIAPARIAESNLALGKAATDSRGPAESENASKVCDGDLSTRWFSGNKAGDWIQIDLGREIDVAEIRMIQNGRAGDFWQQFRIDTALSPDEFEKLPPFDRAFAVEPSWGWTVGHKRDIDPSNFEIHTVYYRNKPKKARYIRITNLKDWGGTMSEIEVRAAL
ncbi:MAG TPA: CARDB domain-containing protein [Armatimonadota bacterium]|nr:CARDB domain-containing protein [Armatimonadota bacterium]